MKGKQAMAKAPVKDQEKHAEPEHVKAVEPEHVKAVEHDSVKVVEPKSVKPVEKPAEPVAHAKTDKAFLDAIEKQHEAEKTVKLRVQKGTDEINHEGVSYKVAQGPATEEWTVEVPAHVAEHILRQGGAVQVVDPGTQDPGEGFVYVRHVSGDPKAKFGHGQNMYEP